MISVEPPYDAAGADAVLHRGVTTLAGAAASRLTFEAFDGTDNPADGPRLIAQLTPDPIAR